MLIKDAEIQGHAAIKGKGFDLMLTLGTGADTGLFGNGEIMTRMEELAHYPVHKGKIYNDYVDDKALKKTGKKRWNNDMSLVIKILNTLLNHNHLYIDGGNARQITHKLPKTVTLVPNNAGLEGRGALWRRLPRSI